LATVLPRWLQQTVAFVQRALILATPRTILSLLFFASIERVSVLNGVCVCVCVCVCVGGPMSCERPDNDAS
jgi:hypothetical protein